MTKRPQLPKKEFFNFSKHSKNNSLIKIAVSPRFCSQNQPMYTKSQYQQRRQISNNKNKQHREISAHTAKGHKRIVSMFTGERQKQIKLQRLSIDPVSLIDPYGFSDKDQTPTFSFIQSSKKIQKHMQPKQQEIDLSIYPLSFKKKNNHSRDNNLTVKAAQIDKLELINEIMFFKNKLDGQIIKNKQLSNTYEQFLDENYQLKQLNLSHPNWNLFQENQHLKEKLKLIQQFQYGTSAPQTPKTRKKQKVDKQQWVPQAFNGTNHNSPIRQLYPFQ